ncbi:MAG TPA: nitroreductase family protein [Syntrophales bacterium]|nr:nitroreductase family protein [Syntrophales bacterium]
MNDYETLLRRRRSVREFQNREVPLDVVREIVRETCLAPSAMNGQPWRFSIVTRREKIKELSDESKRNLLSDLGADPSSPLQRYGDILRDPKFNVFYNAPCVVFICGPSELGSLDVDCSLAACYFMFAAAARNLGTCWIGLGAHVRDTAILKELGIEGGLQIVAPIIVGYPKEIPEVPERNEPVILSVLK